MDQRRGADDVEHALPLRVALLQPADADDDRPFRPGAGRIAIGVHRERDVARHAGRESSRNVPILHLGAEDVHVREAQGKSHAQLLVPWAGSPRRKIEHARDHDGTSEQLRDDQWRESPGPPPDEVDVGRSDVPDPGDHVYIEAQLLEELDVLRIELDALQDRRMLDLGEETDAATPPDACRRTHLTSVLGLMSDDRFLK